MQRFYDDLEVHGTIYADNISGELSETTRASLDNQIADLRDELERAQEALDTAQGKIGELAEKYNNAIEVINDLLERVVALESNYDPTVIN